MQAYKLVCANFFAIILARNEEHLLEKAFGHLDRSREVVNHGQEREFIGEAMIYHLDEEETPLYRIKMYTNGLEFTSPKGENH